MFPWSSGDSEWLIISSSDIATDKLRIQNVLSRRALRGRSRSYVLSRAAVFAAESKESTS